MATSKDTVSPTSLLDSTGIIQVLGIYKNKLQDLRDAGLPTIGEGKAMRYPLAECTKWYINYCIAKETAKMATGGDVEDAKARKATAEALLAEIDVHERLGTLINREVSKKELATFAGILRAGLMSFPSRLAPYVVGIPTEREAREILTTHVQSLMQQMAKQVDEAQEDAAQNDMDEEVSE